MPRKARNAPGGLVYHVLNRANARQRIFRKAEDFLAFEESLLKAQERVPMRILDWCVMADHWHLVLWPRRDGELTEFMRHLTLTHAQRWKYSHAAVGQGHLYQGRFKSFPIQPDEHLLTVLRYVQRNPVRAGLVRRAEQWPWGSCHVRQDRSHRLYELLSAWPLPRPRTWLRTVNSPQDQAEEKRLKEAIARGQPVGGLAWTRRMVPLLGLEHAFRPRGRPLGWRKNRNPKPISK